MQIQSLDSEIQHALPLLRDTEKQSIVSVIRSFLSLRNESSRPTMEEYTREINEAEQRVANGDFYTLEEVEKMAKEW